MIGSKRATGCTVNKGLFPTSGAFEMKTTCLSLAQWLLGVGLFLFSSGSSSMSGDAGAIPLGDATFRLCLMHGDSITFNDTMAKSFDDHKVDAALFPGSNVKIDLKNRMRPYHILQNVDRLFITKPQWLPNFSVQENVVHFVAPDFKEPILIYPLICGISFEEELSYHDIKPVFEGVKFASCYEIKKQVSDVPHQSTLSSQSYQHDSSKSRNAGSIVRRLLGGPGYWKGWTLLAILAILVAIAGWYFFGRN